MLEKDSGAKRARPRSGEIEGARNERQEIEKYLNCERSDPDQSRFKG